MLQKSQSTGIDEGNGEWESKRTMHMTKTAGSHRIGASEVIGYQMPNFVSSFHTFPLRIATIACIIVVPSGGPGSN